MAVLLGGSRGGAKGGVPGAASGARRHPARAAALGLFALWSQACTVMRPLPAGQAAAPRAVVQALAPAGVTLAAPAGALTAAPLCRAVRVEGEVARQVGDTLVLARMYRAAATPGTARCPRVVGPSALVRTSEVALAERRVSRGRTAALVVGLIAAGIAFAAYGASQLDYDFPAGDGSSFARAP